MSKELFIVGAGTYGEVMFELAKLNGYKVKAFYDEDKSKIGTKIMGVEVIGSFSEVNAANIKNNNYVVAIGDNSIRLRLMDYITNSGGNTPTLIHPTAVISPSAEVSRGVYVLANAYIGTKVIIGEYNIICPNVVIAHHTSLGKACLVSNLSGVGASIAIEDKVFIGMGATIMTGVSRVGENSTIGAGAVVIKDVDKNSVYAGVPAKKIRTK